MKAPGLYEVSSQVSTDAILEAALTKMCKKFEETLSSTLKPYTQHVKMAQVACNTCGEPHSTEMCPIDPATVETVNYFGTQRPQFTQSQFSNRGQVNQGWRNPIQASNSAPPGFTPNYNRPVSNAFQ